MKMLLRSQRFILVAFTCIGVCVNLNAQQSERIDTALLPFWKGTTMYNESVMMISTKDELPVATLLFDPIRILRVRNSALNVDYHEGTDWEYRDGKLTLLPGSKAIYMTDKELFPDSSKNSFPRKGGGLVYFREGSFFHSQQLAITYTHAANVWNGIVPSFIKRNLPHAIAKLEKHSGIRLLLFGDSIAEGANASGENDTPPYLPTWGDLIAEALRRYYKTSITFINTAVGGKDSRWGLETAEERVVAHIPDLVIIAFGMNDGTGKMAASVFQTNIRGIIEKTRKINPKTEFILVSTMLPNPESEFVGTQTTFKDVLTKLTGPGIVLVDMTAVHAELLKRKSYQDLTGNHINHPNDFLIRWYAQQILGLLVPTYSN